MAETSSNTHREDSSENRNFDLISDLRASGYSAQQIESILLISKYIDAFTINFDDGKHEYFDFRPKLRLVRGGRL